MMRNGTARMKSTTSRFEVVLDANGHYLIRTTGSGKPVCLIYAHNCASHVAQRRALKTLEAL